MHGSRCDATLVDSEGMSAVTLANSAGRSSRHLTVRVRLEPVSFGEAVATCFRKYATFSGRARQSEFWWWILFIVILGGGSAAVAAATGAVDESGNLDPNSGAAAKSELPTWS